MIDTAAFGTQDASYRAAGEEAGLRKLVERFYAVMDSLPAAQTIRAMHTGDLERSIDKLTLFLCGWLGGPKKYPAKYGPIRIPAAHSHLPVGESERDAWLLCMRLAVAEQDYTPAFKIYLLKELAVPAERIRMVCSQGSPGGAPA